MSNDSADRGWREARQDFLILATVLKTAINLPGSTNWCQTVGSFSPRHALRNNLTRADLGGKRGQRTEEHTVGVIKFPDRQLQPEDQRHAEAFRDLEPYIHDCVMMSRVAAEQMGNAACNDEGLSFAVFHLHEMLLNLEQYYHAAWDGEVPSLVEGSPPSTK